MSAVLLSLPCCLPAELLVAVPGLAFGACHSSLQPGWEHKPERCDTKPKLTSSLGHVLILCKGSVDGLLVQREVGVAQRRDISGPAVTEGDWMGSRGFLLRW